MSYDENSNLIQRRLRDGQLIGFQYDNLNRVRLKGLPASETDVSYTYDLQNKPLTSTQGSASVTLTYDALGTTRTEQTALGTMSYLYDEAGRRTRTTWPDSFYVTQDFLVTDEVSAIRESGATSGMGVLATYGYDDLGRRVSVTRGNGTTTASTYDPASRLTRLRHDLAGTAQDVSSTFEYSPAPQMVSWTRNNPAYAWTAHFNQNKTYAANGLNQLAGGVFSYDGRGNLTNQGAGAYGYTVENRLVSAPSSAALTYDSLGRLYQSSGSAGVTRFQYDGNHMVAEYNASNQMQRRYVYGPAADEVVAWYEGSGTGDRRWLHRDERGSVVAVSNASGSSIAINAYDEYGIPGASNLGRFQYTGQMWIPELGMYYYKARIYTPRLGRFLQTDPIGSRDDPNLYAYVGNDPLGRTDPSGLWTCDMKNQESGCMQVAAGLGRARAAETKMEDGPQRTQFQAVLKLWGKYGDKGVNVKFESGMDHPAHTGLAADRVSVDITFNTDTLRAMTGNQRAAVVAHEGQHGVDALAIAATGDYAKLRSQGQMWETERKAYRLQSHVDEALGTKSFLWSPGMSSKARDGRIQQNAYESVLSDCAPWGPGCTIP